MPKIANYGYLLSAGLETHVVIHPTLHNAANNIRRIRKAARHCLFADEVKLKFYRTYTKGNCELECESDRMEHECGCVTYYLPRSSKNTVVCGLKDFECVRRVQYASESLLDEDTSCARCVPGCVSLNYLPVISGTELLKEDFILKENFSNPDINIEELAVIHFFYEFNSFRARTKEEFLGFADFLANSGGILGLFLGFSMLSVIELLYFMFLLPHTIIKNYFSRKKDIHKEEDISEASTSVKVILYLID
ncbi:unnamed protein product [Hermetia illucens]|uniref:Uncharacterized protein n=1 Tax=Hermetia illucens TaxID=343691 RepID=A0A7R8YVT9_HERIL|nr:unnamed protein product [Hermetia illucens]